MTTLPEVLELRKFVAPEFVFGNGARLLVGRYAANLGARRVLVVTGPTVIAARVSRMGQRNHGQFGRRGRLLRCVFRNLPESSGQ